MISQKSICKKCIHRDYCAIAACNFPLGCYRYEEEKKPEKKGEEKCD